MIIDDYKILIFQLYYSIFCRSWIGHKKNRKIFDLHLHLPLYIYLYGYLNSIQSSRRLEREAGRNVELMWLTGRLAPDFKTIADFRKDNGPAIQAVCTQFVDLCRELGLFVRAVAAIDGARFKAVNARVKNFTKGKLKRRISQVEASIALISW